MDGLTVIPTPLAILLARPTSPASACTRIARAWLALERAAPQVLIGIRTRVTGMEHLPQDPQQGVVLLVKHQSTFETF